jgi:putative transcriptional regulator
MAKKFSKAAREALRTTDWRRVDAMTDVDIARQIAAHADAAPDMAPDIDVRAIREAIGMTQAEFAAAYEFSVRTVQEWERGAKRPSGPARTLLRAIKGDPRDCAERWRRLRRLSDFGLPNRRGVLQAALVPQRVQASADLDRRAPAIAHRLDDSVHPSSERPSPLP